MLKTNALDARGLFDEPRFWAKTIPEPNTGCWLWIGAARPDGYGHLRRRGQSYRANRVAYSLANGPLPAGAVICHRCDNPPCVNPAHLFLGDHKSNMDDAVRKGRMGLQSDGWRGKIRASQARGEARPSSKLTAAVTNIRARLVRGEQQKDVAKAFGVTPGTISAIACGRKWTHVPAE